MKKDPKSVMAHTNKSLYYMRMGEIDKAEVEKALATSKSFAKYGDEAKQKQAEAEEKSRVEKETSKREEMFRQVLALDPEDEMAHLGLGDIYLQRKNFPQAIAHLNKVLDKNPKYSKAYLVLGKALKQSGDLSQARDVFQKGIDIAAGRGDFMPANEMQRELTQLKAER